MAFDPARLRNRAPGGADTASAPLVGTRAQSIQRLQYGLFGLSAMVLLVGLASIIMKNAQQNQARVVPEAASTMAPMAGPSPASDPLADAGVVPDLPVQPQPAPVVSPPPVSGGGDGSAPTQP